MGIDTKGVCIFNNFRNFCVKIQVFSSPADNDFEDYIIAKDACSALIRKVLNSANLTGIKEQAQITGRCVIFQIIRED